METADPLAVDVVVVAAGASRRMGGIDKIEAPMAGRPLLAWTLEGLVSMPNLRSLIVVASADRSEALAHAQWLRDTGATVVRGGARRQESVAAGVRATSGDTMLIHDGARPLVTGDLARRVADAASASGAAIPVVAVTETLKRVVDGRVVATVPRADTAVAQTPQGVRRELLDAAWHQFPPEDDREFTDEAALLEAAGVPVATVEGDPANLKVTEASDLLRAEALLAGRHGALRTGSGSDAHPFGPVDGLCLGGIDIPDAPRLYGHSDGDVALHAVADALLGAAAIGDLGRLFPAGDPATAGIDSSELLRDVVRRVADAGLRPSGLDLTIVAARPRFGPARLDEMRDRIAFLLGLDPQSVSVKASTGNLIGSEGAGRSISAHALVTVVRG